VWPARSASSASRTVVTDASLAASPHTNAVTTVGGQLLQRTDKTMRAIKGFMQLLHGALKDRGLWGMPLDPVSYAVLLNTHANDVRELQRKTLEAHGRRSRGEVREEGSHRSAEQESRLLLHGVEDRSSEMDSFVEELMSASLYARAAYGYPLLGGYLSSMNSAVFMGTLKTIQFDVVGGASADAHNKALLLETHLKESDLLLSEWKSSVCRPCHYVAVDPSRETIIIGVRGSIQPSDVLTDTMAGSLEVSFAGVTGKVHEGMFAAATFVHCNTAGVLKRAVEEHPGWPVIVTGHSLGGGVAAVLAMLLREPEGCPPAVAGRVSCVALGCPAVMTTNLADACRSYVTSLVLRHDFVARLSAASVDLLMQELVNASPMKNLSEKIGGFFRSLSRPRNGTAGPPPPAPSLSDFPGLATHATDSSGIAAMIAAQALEANRTPPTEVPLERMPGDQDPPPETDSAEALSSSLDEPDIPVPASDGGEPASDDGSRRSSQSGGVVLASVCEARLAATAEPEQASGGVGPAAGDSDSGDGSLSSRPSDSFSDHGIRASSGTPPRNQCPHGTGGDTKFDLLYPAGRVLWLVEDESRAAEGKDAAETGMPSPPAAAGQTSPPPSGGAAASTPEKVFEMMEQAWNSVTVGGSVKGAATEKTATVEGAPAAAPGDFQLSEGDSDEEFGARAKPYHGTTLTELKWRPIFVECPPHTFGRLHLNAEMINDHLPDYYSDAIQKLYQEYSKAQLPAP